MGAIKLTFHNQVSYSNYTPRKIMLGIHFMKMNYTTVHRFTHTYAHIYTHTYVYTYIMTSCSENQHKHVSQLDITESRESILRNVLYIPGAKTQLNTLNYLLFTNLSNWLF